MQTTFSFVYVIDTMDFSDNLERLFEAEKNRGVAIEVLFYDTLCEKESREYTSKYKAAHGDRVSVIEKEGWAVEQCWDDSINRAKGKYINFSRVNVYINGPKDTVKRVKEAFEDKAGYKLISCEPFQFWEEKKTYQPFFGARNIEVVLNEQPFRINLEVEAVFFDKTLIGQERFCDTNSMEKAKFFMARMYSKIDKYFLARGRIYFEEAMAKDYYNYPLMFYREWYMDELEKYILPAVKANKASKVFQAAMVMMLQTKLGANVNDRNKSVLDQDDIDRFLDDMKAIFQYIDDDILMQNSYMHKRMLQRFMGMNYLRMKYGKTQLELHKELDKETNEWVVKYGDELIERYKEMHCRIMAIDYEDGQLVFDIELANAYYTDHSNIKTYICYDGKRVELERNQIYCYTKYFGRPVKQGYMVRAFVPHSFIEKCGSFHFEAEFQGESVKLMSKFIKFSSRFCDKKVADYWNFGDGILTYNRDSFEYTISPATKGAIRRKELWYRTYLLIRAIRAGKGRKVALNVCKLRRQYFKEKDNFKGEVWITFDQLFKGGDNGEYFFRYMNENHPEIQMYYIVNEDSKEYAELESLYPGRVLAFNSDRARLVSLMATRLFATRVDVRLYCGFEPAYEIFFRNLFSAEVVCLQHGLTMQNIAQYQNRLFDDLKYYYCVSPYEVKNIMRPVYGYTEDMMSLSGAPRYDGLVGTPKKQILISPTWRRNVTAGTNTKGKNHDYSNNFKNTTYYRIYNSLVNNEKLIETAKRTGYKLIYLIHPILSPQIEDFDTNDYLEIRPGVDVNYEQILKESCLMVTDYSGIQYDFAYMRRPLIYFHPNELPPQYGEGVLTYEEMGFGPICRTNDEVVDALCAAMERDCVIEPEYKANIDRFFPYDDQDNCKRVYEITMDILNKRKAK